MLAVRSTRSLIYRGVSTTNQRNGLINYPLAEKNDTTQAKYIDHPNRNMDYYETFRDPFPFAPRYADKDSVLNELRSKAQGNWSDLSVKEQHKLYHGHFRCALHRYV